VINDLWVMSSGPVLSLPLTTPPAVPADLAGYGFAVSLPWARLFVVPALGARVSSRRRPDCAAAEVHARDQLERRSLRVTKTLRSEATWEVTLSCWSLIMGCMSELCGYCPCKSTGLACRHRVTAGVCWQHERYVTPFSSLAGSLVPAPREPLDHQPTPKRGTRSQLTPVQRKNRKRPSTHRRAGVDQVNSKQLVSFVKDLAESGWQPAVENQLAGRLNNALWNKLQAHRQPSALCRQLAGLADHIENVLQNLVCELTKTEMRAAGAGPFAADLAAELVASSTQLPFGDQLGLLAKRIRVVGVYLCMVTGHLDTCPCLRALFEERTKAGLEVVLRGALAEPPAL